MTNLTSYRTWRQAGKPAHEAFTLARKGEYPTTPFTPPPSRFREGIRFNWRDPLIRAVEEGETPYHVTEWDDFPLLPVAVRISRGGREWWGIGWEVDGEYYLPELHPNYPYAEGEWAYSPATYLSWAEDLTLREVERQREEESARYHAEWWGEDREDMLNLAAEIRAGKATQEQVRALYDQAYGWQRALAYGQPIMPGWEGFEPESDAFHEALSSYYRGNLSAARRIASALETLARENLKI